MRKIIAALAVLLLSGTLAAAAPAPGTLDLELNALQPVEGGCRVTFLATNNLGVALSKSTLEVAIFGEDGGITRVVSLDFKGLTAGKTKVLQFDLKDLACPGVSRVLVNDVTACAGDGIDPGACLSQLKTSTRTSVAFGI
jgi:hypothetical protein